MIADGEEYSATRPWSAVPVRSRKDLVRSSSDFEGASFLDNSIFMIRIAMELLLADLLPKEQPNIRNRAKNQKARRRHGNRGEQVEDEFQKRRPIIHPN